MNDLLIQSRYIEKSLTRREKLQQSLLEGLPTKPVFFIAGGTTVIWLPSGEVITSDPRDPRNSVLGLTCA